MTRVFKWVGISIGGLLLLLLLAALILPSVLNVDRYRNLLANRAGKALGREVTLGALRVSLWHGLGVEAKGITIAPATGFGPQPFLTADALRIQIHVLPLFRGQVQVSSAALERPRIHLTRTPDGRWSVDDLFKGRPAPVAGKLAPEGPRPSRPAMVAGLLLSRVTVRNGEVTLLDQTQTADIPITLTDVVLRIEQPALAEPLSVWLRGQISTPGSGSIEAAAKVAPGDAQGPMVDGTVTFRDVEASPWQKALVGPVSGVRVSGPLSGDLTLRGPLARSSFSGGLDLKSVAIQAGGTFRKPAGENASLNMQGRREDPGVVLTKLALVVKGMKLEGSARIPDLRAPQVSFTMTSPKLDLDRLLATPESKQAWWEPASAWAAASPASSRGGGADSGLSAQGQVSVGELRFHGLNWTGVRADVKYQNGSVRLSSMQAEFMNGRLTASGEVDLLPKSPRVTMTSHLERVATEPLVKALKLGSWSLRSGLDAEADLTFAGFSRRDILESAVGKGSIHLTEGRLSNYRPLERLSEVAGPILASQGVHVRLDEFQSVAGHYTLDNGVLRTQDLTLTKPEGTVTVAGSLNLLDSGLNFDVVAKLGRTTIEAKVTGTTSKPIVLPKLGRLQQNIDKELQKLVPGDRGKALKDLFRGLFGK